MTVSLTSIRFFNLRQWGHYGPHRAQSATDEEVVVVVEEEEKKNVTIPINHP
jgi:hypothetical protein